VTGLGDCLPTAVALSQMAEHGVALRRILRTALHHKRLLHEAQRIEDIRAEVVRLTGNRVSRASNRVACRCRLAIRFKASLMWPLWARIASVSTVRFAAFARSFCSIANENLDRPAEMLIGGCNPGEADVMPSLHSPIFWARAHASLTT